MESTPRERQLIEKLRELAGGETVRKSAMGAQRDAHGRRKRDRRGLVIDKPHGPRTEPEESGGPERDTQGYKLNKRYDPRR